MLDVARERSERTPSGKFVTSRGRARGIGEARMNENKKENAMKIYYLGKNGIRRSG